MPNSLQHLESNVQAPNSKLDRTRNLFERLDAPNLIELLQQLQAKKMVKSRLKTLKLKQKFHNFIIIISKDYLLTAADTLPRLLVAGGE